MDEPVIPDPVTASGLLITNAETKVVLGSGDVLCDMNGVTFTGTSLGPIRWSHVLKARVGVA